MLKKGYKKFIGLLVLIFFVGGIAGILGSNLFLPWLVSFSPFDKIGWMARSKDGVTIINKTEKIVIEPSAAYQEMIERLSKSVVVVESEKILKIVGGKTVPLIKPEILSEGAGLILTSDGLIATANVLVPDLVNQVSVFWNDKQYEAQVVKRDAANNLALLKISEKNLPVVALGEASALKLGEDVFLVGAFLSAGKFAKFIDRGFVKALSPALAFDFSENPAATGSLLANSKGEIWGLSLVGKGKKLTVITAESIRNLLNK